MSFRQTGSAHGRTEASGMRTREQRSTRRKCRPLRRSCTFRFLDAGRRIFALLLAAALVLTVSSCAQQAAEPSGVRGQAAFDAWLEELLPALVDSDSFEAGFYFLDPETAGLPQSGSAFGVVTAEEWDEAGAEAERVLNELNAFDPAKLDSRSQAALALLKDSFARQMALRDFYLLAANNPGLMGSAAQLATTVWHFPYESARDFDRLFAMYEDLGSAFQQLTELEQTRQQENMGMTPAEAALTVEEFEKFLAGDPPAIQQLADERIEAADFLSAAEKEAYHQKNAQAVVEHLVPAYEDLISALQQIPDRSGAPGTAGRRHGRQYYKALLNNLGFDESPEALMNYIEERYDACLEEIRALAMQVADQEALAACLEDPESVAWLPDMAPDAVLAYLQEASAAEFPQLDLGTVSAEITTEALRGNSVMAYYVKAPLDAAADAERFIYINDETRGADYFTLAHEGFPGHLYQDAYAAQAGFPYAQRLVAGSYMGAQEGWGTYSSIVAADWVQTDKTLARIVALSSLANYLIYAWCDVGLNYCGWTNAELAERLARTFGVGFRDAEIEELGQVIAAMPGQWVIYGAGGAKFLELRQRAEAALGSAFDPVAFHTAVLDSGLGSFAMIEDAADSYIEQNRTRLPGAVAA